MILNEWLIVDIAGNMIPPKVPPFAFRGIVRGHENHKDGEKIQTQPIVGYDLQEDAFITAEGGLYRLRQPNHAYLMVFPKSDKELFKLIAKMPYVYYSDMFNLDGRPASMSQR